MANELFIYSTPKESVVALTLDDGRTFTGVPFTASGRDDGHCIQLPSDLTQGMGAVLEVKWDGYYSFRNRGLVMPSSVSNALFMLDDIHLTKKEDSTPVPPPINPDMPNDPEGIINWTYQNGNFDLSTKEGCGQFTEACVTNLHDKLSQWWGHIKKNPGQNQYNGHAVDAIMLASGSGSGIYDIIHDSESSNATPSFNYKGPADLNLWYYPA